MNVLFVCAQNRLRSPTAQAVFASHPQVRALSAGLNRDAETPLSGDLIEWADVIFVMERAQRNRLTTKFRALLQGKRLVVLGIPDEYDYMDPELVQIFKRRVSSILGVQEPA